MTAFLRVKVSKSDICGFWDVDLKVVPFPLPAAGDVEELFPHLRGPCGREDQPGGSSDSRLLEPPSQSWNAHL